MRKLVLAAIAAFFMPVAYAGDPMVAVDSATSQPKPVYQTGNAIWVTLQGSASTPAAVTLESATGDSIINDTADALNVTILDSSGDSAVDAAANAVRTTAYVTENNPSADSIAIAAAGFTTLITVNTGATQAYNLLCWLHVDADGSNVDDVDGLKIYVVPKNVTIGANTPVALGGQSGTTTSDFTAPNPELVSFVRTTDADADLVNLDENDEGLISLKVPASSTVRFDVSLNNDGTMDALCTHD